MNNQNEVWNLIQTTFERLQQGEISRTEKGQIFQQVQKAIDRLGNGVNHAYKALVFVGMYPNVYGVSDHIIELCKAIKAIEKRESKIPKENQRLFLQFSKQALIRAATCGTDKVKNMDKKTHAEQVTGWRINGEVVNGSPTGRVQVLAVHALGWFDGPRVTGTVQRVMNRTGDPELIKASESMIAIFETRASAKRATKFVANLKEQGLSKSASIFKSVVRIAQTLREAVDKKDVETALANIVTLQAYTSNKMSVDAFKEVSRTVEERVDIQVERALIYAARKGDKEVKEKARKALIEMRLSDRTVQKLREARIKQNGMCELATELLRIRKRDIELRPKIRSPSIYRRLARANAR